MPEWVDRLREAFYTSPNEIESTFKVDVLTRSGGKKASVHEILNLNEAILQDQGNKVKSYPMEAYFTGTDGDLKADSFYKSLTEQYTTDSPGKLQHPRWGDLDVMPFEFSQTEQLVTGAGIFRVSVTFYEIPKSDYPVSEATDPSEISSDIDDLGETVDTANESIDLGDPSAIAKFVAQITDLVNVIDDTVGVIANQYDNIRDKYNLIKEDILLQIDQTQEEIQESANGIMSQVNELVNTASDVVNNASGVVSTTLDVVRGFFNAIEEIEGFLNNSETGNETEDRNTAIIHQSISTTTTAATGKVALYTEYETRDMAITALEVVNQSNYLVLSGLDSIITSQGNNFAPDHNTWSSLSDIISKINASLIDRSFDLKAKQSFILTSPSDPISITWKYYKDMTQLEFFIRSNKLMDREIIEIPTGRELVVYV